MGHTKGPAPLPTEAAAEQRQAAKAAKTAQRQQGTKRYSCARTLERFVRRGVGTLGFDAVRADMQCTSCNTRATDKYVSKGYRVTPKHTFPSSIRNTPRPDGARSRGVSGGTQRGETVFRTGSEKSGSS
jgi:hypothetical protein